MPLLRDEPRQIDRVELVGRVRQRNKDLVGGREVLVEEGRRDPRCGQLVELLLRVANEVEPMRRKLRLVSGQPFGDRVSLAGMFDTPGGKHDESRRQIAVAAGEHGREAQILVVRYPREKQWRRCGQPQHRSV